MTSSVRARTGSRRALPTEALDRKCCASCSQKLHLRNDKPPRGWVPILNGTVAVAYTCPACPEWHEPIRRLDTSGGVRFRVVVDATPRGAAKRKQVTRTLDTLDEARSFVAEVRAEVAERGGLADRELTVKKALEDWLTHHESARLESPATANLYRAQWQPVMRAFGDKPVRELTVAEVERLITSMFSGGKRDGKPYGKWAVRAAVGRLSQALDRCVRHKIIGENVAKLVGNMPEDKRGKRKSFDYWKTSGDGVNAMCPAFTEFRAVADRHRDAGAWRLTLCGMTRADVMGLMWADIDLDAGTAEVVRGRVILNGNADYSGDPKSEQRYRTVPFETLEPGTIALLRKMKARQAEERFAAGSAWVDSGYVVVNEAGEPLRPELYSDRFRALCRAAGVPVIHLHKVRHSLAGLLHERTWTPVNAAKLLGHTKDVHIANYLPDGDDESLEATAERLKVKTQAA